MKIKLTEKREKLGLSVVEFAEMCGVSRQSIHSIESGKYKPNIILALIIAKNLSLKVEEIFDLEKEDLHD